MIWISVFKDKSLQLDTICMQVCINKGGEPVQGWENDKMMLKQVIDYTYSG